MRHHRHLLCTALWLAGALACASAQASDTPAVDENARTAAAVKAVDQHWMQAEIHGDSAWLGRLLLPEYRSVGADGEVTTRAAILADAATHRDSDTFAKKVAAWEQAHPTKTRVVLHGNVAIVSFYDPRLGMDKGVRSSDIFVYENERWHALYSQHSHVAE